jgi:hypothetical protein
MVETMSPGGHLVTTAAACAAAMWAGAPVALTAGIALGGFLIDVDHVVDYLVFERQRDLRPGVFLRYYLEGRARRVVLALHSYELFALLLLIAWRTDALLLWGYVLGGLMHLLLDLLYNGELMPHSISAFYSFAYRLSRGFRTATLLGPPPPVVRRGFWSTFFVGAGPDGAAPRPRLRRVSSPD